MNKEDFIDGKIINFKKFLINDLGINPLVL